MIRVRATAGRRPGEVMQGGVWFGLMPLDQDTNWSVQIVSARLMIRRMLTFAHAAERTSGLTRRSLSVLHDGATGALSTRAHITSPARRRCAFSRANFHLCRAQLHERCHLRKQARIYPVVAELQN